MTFQKTLHTRETEEQRKKMSEAFLQKKDFLFPLFLTPNEKEKTVVTGMPHIFRLGIEKILKEIEKCIQKGITSFLLFGVPNEKFDFDKNESPLKWQIFMTKGIQKIKEEFPKIQLITDVCVCSYTHHGHCGVTDERGNIKNDETIEILGKIATEHAEAGADIVAPSSMRDGQVFMIKKYLKDAGRKNIPIMSYAAKFASHYYGPFREAADCAPQFGDRKKYQLPFDNISGAMKKIDIDIQEGAEMIIVKPALAYLDILTQAKQNFSVPLFAYNVSGEYLMIRKLAESDAEYAEKILYENLVGMKRAGAERIISYHAGDLPEWFFEQK